MSRFFPVEGHFRELSAPASCAIRTIGTTSLVMDGLRGCDLFPAAPQTRVVDTSGRIIAVVNTDHSDALHPHSSRTGNLTMPSDKSPQLTDLQRALNLVNKIEKQARRIDDPELKRILLASGCDIIDRVMDQQQIQKAA
jgi:hypothetical protein